MGFFGMVIKTGEKELVEVPPGWCLQLCMAALEPPKGAKPHETSATLWLQVEGEIGDTSFLIGTFQGGGPCAQITVRHCLTSVDGEVIVEARGSGSIHLTGFFDKEYDDEQGSDEDSEEEEEDADETMPSLDARRAISKRGVRKMGDDKDYDEEDSDDDEEEDGNRNASTKKERCRVRFAAVAAAKSFGTKGGKEDLEEEDSEEDGDYLPGENEEDLDDAMDDDDQEDNDNEGEEDDDEEDSGEKQIVDEKKASGSDNGKSPSSKRGAGDDFEKSGAPETKKSRREDEKKGAGEAAAASDGEKEQRELTKQEKKRLRKKENKRKAAEAKRELEKAFSAGGEGEDEDEPPVGVPLKSPRSRALKGGLKVKDTVLGGGKVAVQGKNVKVCYEGCFPDGRVFDKKLNRKKPFGFRLGMKQVIVGMDRGLEGMRVGGSREISIPAALGYGERGTGPIPANQDLVFRVELIDVLGK